MPNPPTNSDRSPAKTGASVHPSCPTTCTVRLKPVARAPVGKSSEESAEVALISALQEHRILAAGLDCQEKEPADPENPLLKLPNVTLTPHNAGPTVDSYRKRFGNGYANIQRVANGQPPLWIIPEMRDLFPAG